MERVVLFVVIQVCIIILLSSPPCSLGESIQDPMVFSLLEVMSLLATANMVPTDAWEFILCALVTIVQVSMTC